MAQTPPKHRQPVTPQDVQHLRQLARENTPTRVMGIKMQRTPAAVRAIAHEHGISLKPVNQRPNKPGKGR